MSHQPSGVRQCAEPDERLVGSGALAHRPDPDNPTDSWCDAIAASWDVVDVEDVHDRDDIEDCPDCLDKMIERKAGGGLDRGRGTATDGGRAERIEQKRERAIEKLENPDPREARAYARAVVAYEDAVEAGADEQNVAGVMMAAAINVTEAAGVDVNVEIEEVQK